jgi:hypothetical protein
MLEPDADLRHDIYPADPVCDGGAKKTGHVLLVAELVGLRRIRTTLKNTGCGPASTYRLKNGPLILVVVFGVDAAQYSLHCNGKTQHYYPGSLYCTELAPGESRSWTEEFTSGCDAKEIRLATFFSPLSCALHTGESNVKIYSNSVTLPPTQ